LVSGVLLVLSVAAAVLTQLLPNGTNPIHVIAPTS
jgi:hypothetical protein